MKLKRIAALLVAASFCIGLAACGKPTTEETTSGTDDAVKVSSSFTDDIRGVTAAVGHIDRGFEAMGAEQINDLGKKAGKPFRSRAGIDDQKQALHDTTSFPI